MKRKPLLKFQILLESNLLKNIKKEKFSGMFTLSPTAVYKRTSAPTLKSDPILQKRFLLQEAII